MGVVLKASKSFLRHMHVRKNFYLSMKQNIYLSDKTRLVKSCDWWNSAILFLGLLAQKPKINKIITTQLLIIIMFQHRVYLTGNFYFFINGQDKCNRFHRILQIIEPLELINAIFRWAIHYIISKNCILRLQTNILNSFKIVELKPASMYLPKLPFSCKVLKNFLDPLDIEGVHFTIWEITC